MTTKAGNVITMSLWLKQLGEQDGNGRKLAILEPVDRTVGKVSSCLDSEHTYFAIPCVALSSLLRPLSKET